MKASGVENRTAINATFTDAFYLATPPSPDTQQILSDSEVPACAVFFRRVNATFPGSDTSLASATGTCASAMHQGCIDALTRRASQLDVGNSSSSEAVCARLQAEFEQNLDAECAQYAYGLDAWQDVSVLCKRHCRFKQFSWGANDDYFSFLLLAIAGRVPITTEQNTSSNCWPILPKADDLTLIGEFGNFVSLHKHLDYLKLQQGILADVLYEKSNFDENTDSAMLYEMTPILSVFYPGGGNEGDSLVSSAEAQLTCLKVVQQSYGEPQTPPSKGSAPRSMLMSIEVLMGAACISLATLLL